MAALSYDSVEILSHFSERANIAFPLLADPDHRVIERFGLVNQEVPKDHAYYGFAYAGYYLIDEHGVVTSKYFNEENNNRSTAAGILIRELDGQAGLEQGEVETRNLTLRWSVSNPILRPGQRGVLKLDVEPKSKWHVYTPEVEKYIPVSWRMNDIDGVIEFAAATFPAGQELHLPALEETVPVYSDSFQVLRDVRLLGGQQMPEALQDKKELVVEGAFKYQACDDEKCDFPVTIPLKWTFQLEEHDLTRVPEEMQRQ